MNLACSEIMWSANAAIFDVSTIIIKMKKVVNWCEKAAIFDATTFITRKEAVKYDNETFSNTITKLT